MGNRFLIGGTTFIVTLHRGHYAHIVRLRTVVSIRYEITSVGNTETCFSSLSINVCVSCHSVTSFNTFTDNFYHCTVHLDIIKVFYLPTDAFYISLRKTLKLTFIHSFSILSEDRSKASSKTIPPHSAI